MDTCQCYEEYNMSYLAFRLAHIATLRPVLSITGIQISLFCLSNQMCLCMVQIT